MNLHCVAFDFRIERIEVFFKLGLGQGLARMLEKSLQQCSFARGKAKCAPVAHDGLGCKVDLQAADFDQGLGLPL